MSVGKRLEEFRLLNKDRFPTKGHLASALGMKSQQLARYLSDQRKPATEILEKLAELGCDINWLLVGVKHQQIDKLEGYLNSIKNSGNSIQQMNAKANPEEEEHNKDFLNKLEKFESQLNEFLELKDFITELKQRLNK